MEINIYIYIQPANLVYIESTQLQGQVPSFDNVGVTDAQKLDPSQLETGSPHRPKKMFYNYFWSQILFVINIEVNVIHICILQYLTKMRRTLQYLTKMRRTLQCNVYYKYIHCSVTMHFYHFHISGMRFDFTLKGICISLLIDLCVCTWMFIFCDRILVLQHPEHESKNSLVIIQEYCQK